MTIATISKINAAVKDLGVELVKGQGYFYFWSLDDRFLADSIRSVYCTTIKCMTLEEWVDYIKEGIAAA